MANILIVDDNEEIAELIGFACEERGHEWTATREAAGARTLLSGTAFDLAVVDYHLSGRKDGLALANELAATGLAVILMSGDPVEAPRGMPFLQKPFRLSALGDLVDRTLSAKETGVGLSICSGQAGAPNV